MTDCVSRRQVCSFARWAAKGWFIVTAQKAARSCRKWFHHSDSWVFNIRDAVAIKCVRICSSFSANQRWFWFYGGTKLHQQEDKAMGFFFFLKSASKLKLWSEAKTGVSIWIPKENRRSKRLSAQFWYLCRQKSRFPLKSFQLNLKPIMGAVSDFFFCWRKKWKSDSRVLAANTRENMKSDSPQRFSWMFPKTLNCRSLRHHIKP